MYRRCKTTREGIPNTFVSSSLKRIAVDLLHALDVPRRLET